jgi:hypothetical protein
MTLRERLLGMREILLTRVTTAQNETDRPVREIPLPLREAHAVITLLAEVADARCEQVVLGPVDGRPVSAQCVLNGCRNWSEFGDV